VGDFIRLKSQQRDVGIQLKLKLFVRTHLDCTEGVEQVRVVPNAGTDTATLVLTGFNEVYDLLSVHSVQLAHQVHHRQTPVDPAHPQVLRQRVLLNTPHTRFLLYWSIIVIF